MLNLPSGVAFLLLAPVPSDSIAGPPTGSRALAQFNNQHSTFLLPEKINEKMSENINVRKYFRTFIYMYVRLYFSIYLFI